MGRPFALDFGAVMTMGQHLGADLELLAVALPGVEDAIIANIAGEEPQIEGD